MKLRIIKNGKEAYIQDENDTCLCSFNLKFTMAVNAKNYNTLVDLLNTGHYVLDLDHVERILFNSTETRFMENLRKGSALHANQIQVSMAIDDYLNGDISVIMLKKYLWQSGNLNREALMHKKDTILGNPELLEFLGEFL